MGDRVGRRRTLVLGALGLVFAGSVLWSLVRIEERLEAVEERQAGAVSPLDVPDAELPPLAFERRRGVVR